MRMTLLDMTQSILSSLGSDQVNSISDTVESLQVAECLRTTYFNMIGRYDLPEHNQLTQLVPSNNPQQPTLMFLPAGISRVEWIKYFDTNPMDSQQVDQFGSFQHGLNLDLVLTTPGWVTSSNTTNTIALGTQTFTVQPNLTAIQPNNTAYCFSSIPPLSSVNSMSGTVTSYNISTGVLVLNITAINGSGTFNTWTISNTQAGAFGPGYKYVQMLAIDPFLSMLDQFDQTQSDVGAYELVVIDDNTQVSQNFLIKYKNDHQPQYCTILSNQWVIFDSYDNTQDSTLQANKSMAFAWSVPAWIMQDTFIPNIQIQHFPLMLADAKSLAFYELKQMPHQKAEDEVSRQLVSLQKWKAIAGKPGYFEELPSFGRRGSTFVEKRFGGTYVW